jgi:succinate-semialdehyde dehydrogenase/glutarate-semialdehyde dehydrogenase
MKTVPSFWFEPRAWIDGSWHATEETIAIHNPATRALLANVSRTDARSVHQAVEGAIEAQKTWREIAPATRGTILQGAAKLLVERKDLFGRLLSAEQGKPYAQAVGEVEYAASFFQWFGEEARRSHGRIVPHPEAGREFLIQHRPIGVAGLITPWNFPLAQGAKKIAAALASGCTAVWKPAESTPLIALALAPLLAECGLPSGVLQIVPGPGAVIGKIFAEHPAIRVLSLTGSTETGAQLMSAAAPQIKRLSLELGGNAPLIVLRDADLEFTAEQLVRMKLFVSGQVCVTANRVFVPREMVETFVGIVVDLLRSKRVGNGLSDGVDAGPLIHQRACREVQATLSESVAKGARIVYQNQSYLDDGELDHQAFFPPTVVTEVDDQMGLSCKEIFAPIISILAYDSVHHAIERANNTQYGLAGYVYGHDLAQCRAVATQLEVGIVGVNEWRPLKAEIPFGGIKQSGIGAEGGEEGMREFVTTQVISLPKPTVQS